MCNRKDSNLKNIKLVKGLITIINILEVLSFYVTSELYDSTYHNDASLVQNIKQLAVLLHSIKDGQRIHSFVEEHIFDKTFVDGHDTEAAYKELKIEEFRTSL